MTEPPPLRDDCFALPPGVRWVPVEEALDRLRVALSPVAATEDVPIDRALGRVLAAPIRAARSHPPARNAAVDGFAFAHADLGSAPHRLPLQSGRAAAGSPHKGAVECGHALRILTGAILPARVDTVVLEEDVVADAAGIGFARAPKPGANTRPAGEDVEAGAEILPGGRVLQPQDLALAAATGVAALAVRRPLRVGVLSTGDELLPPDGQAPPHLTFDANRPMLAALLRRWNIESVDLGIAADEPGAVATALDRGAAETDAVLTSGGASAGDEDHVSRLLRTEGTLQTWRVAMKPGRPLALATWKGIPVFGLPGNPVASFVCALIFARPALLHLAGAPWGEPRALLVPAAFAKTKKAGRREYLRARLTPEGAVETFRSEGSGRISGLVWADGLVELPEPAGAVAPGDLVRYLPFSAFGL
jgi:molybdopterin molybdotransferase